MKRMFLNRLSWAIPTILMIVVVNFFILRFAPGDPITALVGEYPVSAEYMEQIRRDLGLDRSLPEQLILYVGQIFQGKLGYSFVNQQDVLTLIVRRSLNSMLLFVPSILLATLLGVLIARMAVAKKGSAIDPLLNGITLFGYSVPTFWLGQMLILGFAVTLGWLPAQGMVNIRGAATGPALVLDFVIHWIMPGTCVMLFYLAVVCRVARASLDEAQSQDFIVTARAKGLSRRSTFWFHVLPNGLMPLITVFGYNFGAALTSTVMVETVFAWPGLGSLLMSSITTRDYPVVQGIFLVTATAVVLVNLFTDLLYGLLDPRIRHAYNTRA